MAIRRCDPDQRSDQICGPCRDGEQRHDEHICAMIPAVVEIFSVIRAVIRAVLTSMVRAVICAVIRTVIRPMFRFRPPTGPYAQERADPATEAARGAPSRNKRPHPSRCKRYPVSRQEVPRHSHDCAYWRRKRVPANSCWPAAGSPWRLSTLRVAAGCRGPVAGSARIHRNGCNGCNGCNGWDAKVAHRIPVTAPGRCATTGLTSP